MAKSNGANTTKARQPARDVNRALRVKQAIEMRLKGHEWEEIALQCGIKGGKGAAYHLVNGALRATLREPAEELRTLEALRLDKLLTVFWPKAMEGDAWSFDRVIKLMERRSHLLGLDRQPEKADAPEAVVLIREVNFSTELV